jgi:hypothetical protein
MLSEGPGGTAPEQADAAYDRETGWHAAGADAPCAGSRPVRGSTRPRYLTGSARVQVLFSCCASANVRRASLPLRVAKFDACLSCATSR